MNLPTEQQAHDLIEKYSSSTQQHLYQVGAIMKYFAAKLGEDTHYWWLVGVLHDIDWDHIEKDGSKHMKDDFESILSEIDAPSELLGDIRAHGFFLDGIEEEPNTLVRKYINAVDELSGFIWAYFRMIPSEDVMDIKAKSIKKKLKDKGFAAGVDREHTMNCETMLDIPLDDFIEDIKYALKESDRTWIK
ncbi:hydrolase [Candidatus Gracilibacteria bacterium]|nr:hydrolase [Candidatus Gracilibacteria bacterium]